MIWKELETKQRQQQLQLPFPRISRKQQRIKPYLTTDFAEAATDQDFGGTALAHHGDCSSLNFFALSAAVSVKSVEKLLLLPLRGLIRGCFREIRGKLLLLPLLGLIRGCLRETRGRAVVVLPSRLPSESEPKTMEQKEL